MKNSKRKITVGNYITLAIIFIVALLALYLGRKVYLDYEQYSLKTVVLSGVVSELRPSEVDNYIRDNADVLLFIGVSDDTNSRKIEKELLKLINKDKLVEEIVYLNLSDEENKSVVIENFNKKYVVNDNHKIANYPAMVLLVERKVTATVSKKGEELKYSEIEKFLDQYELTQWIT